MIEPQKTEDIKLDSSKKLKEVLVSVGDVVDNTTPLFSYDTDDIALSISQAKIELDRIKNDINSYIAQIAQLEKEKQVAPESENYTVTSTVSGIVKTLKDSTTTSDTEPFLVINGAEGYM